MSIHGTADLLRLCAAGRDPGVWEEFVRRFGFRLEAGVRRALRRVGARLRSDELEDYIQDVYCRLLEHEARSLRLCRGAEEGSVGAYLGRVAETVVIDRIRASGAVKRGRDRLVNAPADSECDPIHRVADLGPSPEERLLARERRLLFLVGCRKAAGPRHPKRDFHVLRLAFLEGLSSREICRRMGKGLTPASVDSVVHRARRRLESDGLAIPRRPHAGAGASE
jgi:RNA polymerase sigma factor (sigma-70 family)